MLKEIRKTLRARSKDRLITRKYTYFQSFPGGYGEGDEFLGVDNPNLREVAREYRDKIGLKVIRQLLHSEYHEERLLALIILERKFDRACKKKTLDEKLQQDIYELYLQEKKAINNWDLVDLSSSQILGRYLLPRENRSILYELAESGDLWQERIAIISTHAFIRAGDFTDTLKLAARFLQHPHDLMHKAVGWMLREVGKKDLNTELNFLRNHHYNTIPRTTLRYAIEKFPEDLRQQYLKGEA